jgi:beta-glucanase (GH16 family)
MRKSSIFTLLLLSFLTAMDFPQSEGFREDFGSSDLTHFSYGSTGRNSAFKWQSGKSLGREYEVLSFKLDPKEQSGPGKGPEIISKDFTHFGTYSARLKVPDPRLHQPKVGAVVGLFTYQDDEQLGLSEIDFEWLIADPTVIYIGTWTGKSGELRRVGRTINLAKGLIYTTEERLDHKSHRTKLVGTKPDFIETIPRFDASSDFHTYGFDWKPDRIRWWMIHPVTSDTLVLWDYRGERGIPQHPSRYRVNFWHTDNWSVETRRDALEKPKKRYELEVDWMEYRPF